LRADGGKQAQTEGCEEGWAHALIVAWLLVVGGWLLVVVEPLTLLQAGGAKGDPLCVRARFFSKFRETKPTNAVFGRMKHPGSEYRRRTGAGW
jgi:hypothetical protein